MEHIARGYVVTVQNGVEIAVNRLVVAVIGENRAEHRIIAVVGMLQIPVVVGGLGDGVIYPRSGNVYPAVGVRILLGERGKACPHLLELFVVILGYHICAEGDSVGEAEHL